MFRNQASLPERGWMQMDKYHKHVFLCHRQIEKLKKQVLNTTRTIISTLFTNIAIPIKLMLHTIAKFGANEIRDSGRLYSCVFRPKHYHRNASQTFGRRKDKCHSFLVNLFNYYGSATSNLEHFYKAVWKILTVVRFFFGVLLLFLPC